MRFLKINLLLVAVLAAPVAYAVTMLASPAGKMVGPEMITLPAGEVTYRPAGDFSRAGKPMNAPPNTVRFAHALQIMKRQVTQAEYWTCVEDGGCPSVISLSPISVDEPMVSVSWRDAEAYAGWLSRRTGKSYRLPTDAEWAFASGCRFHDEGWPDVDGGDPARRWLARYESESAQEPIDKTPRSIGSFGANENGLLDIAGNVWEWTNTCFARVEVGDVGEQVVTTINCGVRVVEGRHRTYVTDFIRDARSGGCSVGTPPANLGFRLVKGDANRTLGF
jgi:formylglycine-generating enzyme required for sulfatase activity